MWISPFSALPSSRISIRGEVSTRKESLLPLTRPRLRALRTRLPSKYENQLHGPPALGDILLPSPRGNRSGGILSRFGAPYDREVELNETIRLCDVEAFRTRTAVKALATTNNDQMDKLTASVARLSTSNIRPVIYRYIDVIISSHAILEAFHFELFMPDRNDLRFLSVPFTNIPDGTIEGDFFRLTSACLLVDPSFAINLGNVEYPVVWEVKRLERVEFKPQEDLDGLAYIVKRNIRRGGEAAISDISDRDFFIRETLFPNEDSRREHSIVAVAMQDMFTAHIYPVEPPLPPTSKEDYVIKILESLSHKDLMRVYEAFLGRPPPKNESETEMLQFLENYAEHEELLEALDDLDSLSSKDDVKRRAAFDARSEYLKRVSGTRTSSQFARRVVRHVRALSAAEEARIEDRLGEFTTYGKPGDLRLMDELFRLGSCYRASQSRDADSMEVGEMNIDESIVLKTLMDKDIGSLERCRPLLDCIYYKDAVNSVTVKPRHQMRSFLNGSRGGVVTLNAQQSHALRLYADPDGPRVFCILSPPGSGKTTVAAAMAAEVGRSTEKYYGSVQLLLSVQNVAVDNMGAALKNMDYGVGEVYNMKSSKKLNFNDPAPYDFFDLMNERDLEGWKNGEEKGAEEYITQHRREYEKTVCSKIILSTVEMVLQKMYTDSKLCSDLVNVKRIIIDEASLLTEAALYAIIRRFPAARIVLIGDDHQLPLFMYDETILGQELAGRPALTVAMKTGRVPVVKLTELYRAPPSLVAPYNRLAYGGTLVSKKGEEDYPLSDIGLIHYGIPQLLLIDVDGREERNEMTMSLSNTKELEVLIRLLKKFPLHLAEDVMIICLYKDQKNRLEELLEKKSVSHSNVDKLYKVFTVDSAQGKESPIVILLTTRTQPATDFFCSKERCNVAVSRQQKALIILGKVPLLGTNQPWSTVVNGDDFTRIRAEDIK